jgi:bacterioferritin-associated ferredoxin
MEASRKLTTEEIKARFRVVCICKGIKLGKISDAIRAGAKTVQEVNRATGSGRGQCKATRCRPVIEEMLRNGGRPPSQTAAPESEEQEPWAVETALPVAPSPAAPSPAAPAPGPTAPTGRGRRRRGRRRRR